MIDSFQPDRAFGLGRIFRGRTACLFNLLSGPGRMLVAARSESTTAAGGEEESYRIASHEEGHLEEDRHNGR